MRPAAIAVVVVGCATPPLARPTSAVAPLSLAADARMVAIPSGRYIAGSTPEERNTAYDDYLASAGTDVARENKWFDSEQDRRIAQLDGFRIDLMPVTNAQYAELVSTGEAPAPVIDDEAWRAQGFMQDYATQVTRFVWTDNRPPVAREDHPVVLVTWAEADRYCTWRGQHRGEVRRLPTAEEYEKAARGESGMSYPWGNVYEAGKLNSAVEGPNDTTPVGQYIAGASPYGVLELAGNVFHWTATPGEHSKMIVKGSAWEDFAGVGRGASGHARGTEVRHVIVGFRCAAGP